MQTPGRVGKTPQEQSSGRQASTPSRTNVVGNRATQVWAVVLMASVVVGCGTSTSPGAPNGASQRSVGSPAASQTGPPTASLKAAEGDTWIVFQALFNGDADLGLVRPDGSASQRIPGGPGNRWHPDWSPDGTQLAYDWILPTDVAEIAILNLDGSGERSLLECVEPCLGNGGPAWSPDGRTIGFDGAEGPTDAYPNGVCYIALLDLGSGDATRILEFPECLSNDPADDLAAGIYMRFSPDGERIVFQGLGPQGTAIFTAAIDGQNVRQLTAWGLGARPDWSPDGEWIVFQSLDTEEHGDEPISIHRIRPDGRDLEQLTAPYGTTIDLYPRWLVDGSEILFSRCPYREAPDCEARVVSPDGGGEARLLLPFAQAAVHLIWQPAER